MCIRDRHEPDRFLIHHGNLSASYRESAEELMRDDEQRQTTVTTATLELGIDIGRLERAFQIDAPVSYTHLDVYKRQIMTRMSTTA